MPNKGVILSSGHFSLTSVLNGLVEHGYEVRTYDDTESNAICEKDKFQDIARYMGNNWEANPENEDFLRKVCAYYLKELAIGGMSLGNEEYPIIYGSNVLSQQYFRSLVLHSYAETTFTESDVKAIILHTDKPLASAVLAKTASVRNIPVFCIHNGMFSQFRYTYSEPAYINSDFYFLRGKYEEEWLEKRNRSISCMVSGAPSWDMYYTDEETLREKNTFLYCPTHAHNVFDKIKVFQVVASWYRNVLPSYGDKIFFSAFKRYKDANSKAKLWVAPRPFSNKLYYEEMLKAFGISDFTVFDGGTFRQLIKKATCLISWVSTVVVEGVITRTPTIMLSKNDFMLDHFNGEGAYLIATEQDIVDKLKKIRRKKIVEGILEKCNERAEYYNYKDDGKATERIVDYMNDILSRR